MLYIVLGAVAVFCFAFCFYMLAQVEKKDPEPHRPAWQDADADEEEQKITYRSSRRIRGVEDKSTPWRHDPPEEEEEDEEPETVYDLSEKKEVPSETKKFSPVTRDELPEKKDLSATKKFSPVTEDDPEPGRYRKSRLQKTLDILCGILFAVAIALLIFDIYIHGGLG